MPVADGGPDLIGNGIALSATLHWLFDHGLISVAEDHSILISHNRVSQGDVARLIRPGHRLRLPDRSADHPHPDFLRYHREVKFGT